MRHWIRLPVIVGMTLSTACSLAAHSPLQGPASLRAAGAGGNRVNLALFVGMDDYNGNTQHELQSAHQLLASVGSTATFGIFMSGDSDVKQDGFRTRIEPNQQWQQGFISRGEMNTGNAATLRDYLGWFGKQHPAQVTHLAINAHGGGYSGLLWDYAGDTKGPSSNLTLKRAYKAMAKGFQGSRIDSVTFDACMMATIEVGESIKGTVAHFTGSEDFSMGQSMPWDLIAAAVRDGKAVSGEAFARFLTKTVIANGRYGADGTKTWSAIRLDRSFDQLVVATDRLAGALLRAMTTEPQNVRAAVKATRMFASMAAHADDYGDYYQRDLIDFCRTLRRHVKDPAVQQAADAVEAGVGNVVFAFAKHPSETMAHGLAVFLPHEVAPNRFGRMLKEYRDTVYARRTRWDEFLAVLNGVQP